MADRAAGYGALPPDAQRILRVLSVVCEPVGQQALQKVLHALGWRDSQGVPLGQRMDKDLRERLLAEGLIEQTRAGLTCHPDLLEPLTRETVADGTFAAIAAAAERVVPSGPRHAWKQPTPEQLLREVRLALYVGDESKVLEVLGMDRAESASRIPFSVVAPLSRVCIHSPDPAWIARLSPRLQIFALAPLLRESALDLVADPESYGLMERLLTPLAAAHVDAAEALVWQRLLRGRLGEAAVPLAGREDPEALVLHGWLAFLRGDYGRAIARVELAELAVRRQTRKRNIYTPGLPGALYLAALLHRGDRADYERVQRQVALCQRAPVSDPLEPVYRVLGELASVLAGRQRPEESYWLKGSIAGYGPFPTLFQAYAVAWLGAPVPGDLLPALAAYAGQAARAGLDWYALEAVALLGALGYKGELPTCGDPPADLVLATRLLAPRSAWEIALEALQAVAGEGAGDKASPAEGSAQRLAWMLSLQGGIATLEPREQRRTKAGAWTQGRPVALQRLADDPDRFPYLTAQDRQICACILREQERSWYNGQVRTLYRLDQDRALVVAAGHPSVLRAGAHTPLELVRGAPVLAAERRARDMLVRIDPFPPEGRSVLPLEEGTQRIRLVEFDARHRQIARILGPDGLRIPKGGEERLLAGLATLVPLLTVHSDIGGPAEGAESVPADPRPHLHLTPLEGGLMLELRVHPFGSFGPQIRPGQGRATLFAERDQQAVRCTRDLDGELEAARAVLEHCPTLAGGAGWDWVLDDLELALAALEQLHALGEAVVLDWPAGKPIALTREAQVAQMRVAIRQRGDWLAIDGGLTLDDGRVLGMRELLDRVAAASGRFVPLGEGEFLVLSRALRRRLEGLRGLTDKGRFHPLVAPAIEEAVGGMALTSDKAWKGLLQRLAEANDLDPRVPSTLQAELRDYQVEGYQWLSRLAHWGAGACLADDMGLGKTVQALALILSRAPQGPTLVVAPLSVCGNWIDEARRFAQTLRPHRFGAGDRASVLKEAGPFDLIVASYGLLQTEGERLAQIQWETVVADEAQAFKNALTKRSQAVMRLRASFRLILTGTPIENHLGELWNLFRFINPGLLGSMEAFNRRFAVPIEQSRVEPGADRGARQHLRQLLRPFILRRLKSEVLSELPPRTEITLGLEFSAGEQALYEALRRQAIERVDEAAGDQAGTERMVILAEIMRLRRACCHPRLVLPESDLPSAKLEAFSEIVDELLENHHKALVFSQFVDHLGLIRQHLDARGIPYQYLDGSTPEAQRHASVAAFQSGEGELFLISLRAGGAGLNLTAADYVIHMDPWWNPAVEDQASDRAHRIGQERPVTIYRLVAKGTIEERILRLHATKRDLADGLLAGTGDGGRLSYADMLALVRGGEAGD